MGNVSSGDVLSIILDLYWVLAIAAAVIALLPIDGIDWFRNAVIVSACRGKLTDQAPKNAFGPLSDLFVPQKWFAHFYMVGCVSNALILYWVYQETAQTFSSGAAASMFSCATLVLLQIHLIRRLLETLFMLQYPKEARMHIVAYLFGMSYYVIVPLTYGTACVSLSQHENVRDSHMILGIVVFFLGNVIQCHSHYLLSILTRRGKGQYVIPRRGLFQLVSCPHYFGEIVIYLGLSIVHVRDPLYVWFPLAWVVVNLVLAAQMTHRWYTSHFKTYPVGRKMLVPFLY